MDESELQNALEMPTGLTNLGNTCYMNATVQCLKTVPEFLESVLKFASGGSSAAYRQTYEDLWPRLLTGDGAGGIAEAVTGALRSLYQSMENGRGTVPPFVFLQAMHLAFPRFSEKTEQGAFQQQDANECWVELLGLLKQKLPSHGNEAFSYVKCMFPLYIQIKVYDFYCTDFHYQVCD